MTREERDELATVLFLRMLSGRSVWVNSAAKQMVGIQMIGLDDGGEVIAWDHDGNDRLCEEYLLTSPRGAVKPVA